MFRLLVRVAFFLTTAVCLIVKAAAQDSGDKRLVKQGKLVLETSMETQPIQFDGRKLLLVYHHLVRALAPPAVHEDWPRHNCLYFMDLDTGKRTKGFASGFGQPLTTASSVAGWAQPGVIEIPLGKPHFVDHVVLEEDLTKGQHVLEYAVDANFEGRWTVAAVGQSIGRKHIQHFDPPVPARSLRLRIVKTNAIPTIQAASCYGKPQ
jgi:hypothetical protein